MPGLLLELSQAKKGIAKEEFPMIRVIMGLKGSGKTKKMIDAIHETLSHATGDVVCIEYGKKLTYDVNYKVRLVDSKEYAIVGANMLKGFLSGLHAGNFDITHVFIDNLYKTIGNDKAEGEAFIKWCAQFAAANNMNITITVSDDPEAASDDIKQYL
jgi:hypothetical protein